MASSRAELSQTHNQIRSLSLPSKLNPISQRIAEKLKKLRAKEESSASASQAIIVGLSGMAELYECINEVLCLPLTQQGLSLRQHERHVCGLVKTCSSLLQACNSAREIVLQHLEMVKELVQVCESSNMEKVVTSRYTSSRKDMIKRAKGVLLSLAKFEDDSFTSGEYQLSAVVQALRCVTIINMSVCESVLFFLSKPVSKLPKWSLIVSEVLKKGIGKRDDRGKSTGNELNDVDIGLHSLVSSGKGGEHGDVLGNLKALVGVMEGIENGLESVCKQMIETKTFLSNILSF